MKKSSFETFFEIFNCCFTTCVYCDEFRRKGQRVLPDHTSSAETAKVFSEYFSGKIDNICRELSACRDADDCVDTNTSRGFTSELSSFNAPNGSDQTDHN